MKIHLLFIGMLGLATASFAQHDTYYSHFPFNKLVYNPAYAGAKGILDAGMIYRHQWLTIDGAPRTLNGFVHMPVAGRSGLGLSVTADKAGMISTQSVEGSYSYALPLDASGRVLQLGLSARLELGRIDWEKATPISINDSSIPDVGFSQSGANVGFGVYYKGQRFFAGASLPRLLKPTAFLASPRRTVRYQQWLTGYLMAGGVFDLSEKIKLHPMALISYHGTAPLDLEINASLVFNDRFWLGAGYRLEDALLGLLQYQINNQLRLGFAYDLTLSELRKTTSGSFEIMAGYTLECESCRIQHLRYF